MLSAPEKKKKKEKPRIKKKKIPQWFVQSITSLSLKEPSFTNHLSTNKSEYSDGRKRAMKKIAPTLNKNLHVKQVGK